jgi:hypothetical protein
MQMYEPDEHSRHFIAHIDSATDPKSGEKRKISKDASEVLCFDEREQTRNTLPNYNPTFRRVTLSNRIVQQIVCDFVFLRGHDIKKTSDVLSDVFGTVRLSPQ